MKRQFTSVVYPIIMAGVILASVTGCSEKSAFNESTAVVTTEATATEVTAAEQSTEAAATAPAKAAAAETMKGKTAANGYVTYEVEDETADVPVVYMTRNITPEGLVNVYKAMGWTPKGKVGVKISTGEPPASNYLRPELIGSLVKDELGAAIVEDNTIYGGSRSSNEMHKQVAKDHGFLEIADFDLLDEDGYMQIPVNGGTRLSYDYVGSHFKDYDSYLVLSHFKGHAMAGFGGAIKNLSIGFGSGAGVEKSGKVLIHTGGTQEDSGENINWFALDQDAFTDAMAEAAKGVCDYMGNEEGIAFVNVLNRLSIDCDCDGNPSEPDMHDIGILASTDPLAIDQAAIDLIYSYENKEDDSAETLIARIEDRNGLNALSHGEAIGLGRGSRYYRLVVID